jgi:hypothetical protein
MSANGTELRERHIGELIARLGSETATLVRQEMELVRAELRERVEGVHDDLDAAVRLARSETSQKVDQAKADVAAKGRKAGIGLGMLAVAGVAALLALGALTAGFVLVLNRWLAADLAALVVTVVWALVAAVTALRGRGALAGTFGFDASRYVPRQTVDAVRETIEKIGDVERLKPKHTIETVKEDVEWAKTRGRSDAR